MSRKSDARSPLGFASIGLVRPKTPANVGGVLRAAYAYGVAQVVISGNRSGDIRHGTNTSRAERHMPVVVVDDLLAVRPYDTPIVAVDLVPNACPLPDFRHPSRAFYVFGPEDGTLGGEIIRAATHRVMVPTRTCMNLAACVNVVLYDRMAKGYAFAREGAS